jgi:hypothetical protein
LALGDESVVGHDAEQQQEDDEAEDDPKPDHGLSSRTPAVSGRPPGL